MYIKFKKGDYVLLKDAHGIHTLEKDKIYKVCNVVKNHNGDQVIQLESEDEHYYNAKRFKKDYTILRKQKIQKINKTDG